MKTGRNEPCPCGSGQKSKHCCGGRPKGLSGWAGPALALLVLAAGATGLVSALRRGAPAATNNAAAPPSPVAPTEGSGQPLSQPPSPAPPGKVWSAEHGHWHNVAAPASSAPVRIETPNPAIKIETSNPPEGSDHFSLTPGQAPRPGMIWSAAHGHWHYEGTGTTSPITDVRAFPAGPPPPVAQPPGLAPEGKVWSVEHGHWHDAPKPQR